MFLFILESIGTQELILIAAVALIVFGPRKLPQLAKKIGKTMAEFRNATHEFKSTWEKEVAFEEEEKPDENKLIYSTENTISRTDEPESEDALSPIVVNALTPQIKEISAEEAARIFQNKTNPTEESKPDEESQPDEKYSEKTVSAKRDWL